MIKIFANSRAVSAASALVTSPTTLLPASMPSLVYGNKIRYRVFIVDGFGGFEPYSGDNTYTLKMSIGSLTPVSVVISQNTWVQENDTIEGIATSGWAATLDASVAAVGTFIAGVDVKEAVWEFQLTVPGGEIFTPIQAPVRIYNRVIA